MICKNIFFRVCYIKIRFYIEKMEKILPTIWEIIADNQLEKTEIEQLREKYNITQESISSLSRENWIQLYHTIKIQEWTKNIEDLQKILWETPDLKFWKESWSQLQEKTFEYDNKRVSIGKIISWNTIHTQLLQRFLDQYNITYNTIQTNDFDTMRILLEQIKREEWSDIIKKLQILSGLKNDDIDGEIWRKTWKQLLYYIKNNKQKQNISWKNNEKKQIKKSLWWKKIPWKSLSPWWKKFAALTKKNPWEVRAIPGYDINKMLWRIVIPTHRWEVWYFHTPEHHEQDWEHKEEKILFDSHEKWQNHEQFHVWQNISQNIFWIQNPFEVNKIHNHDILNFWHKHENIAWNDYHNGFDYTINPIQQNISYTKENKKIWGQHYQEHDSELFQIYASQKSQSEDNSTQISWINFWQLQNEDEKNIFWNFSWQNYDFTEKNKNTQNNFHYWANAFFSPDLWNIFSWNIWIAQKKSWENAHISWNVSYWSNINIVHDTETIVMPSGFIQGNIDYSLKKFQCNSQLEYTLWQHAQNIWIQNNCYDTNHSFWNYYENYIFQWENHEKIWLFYGYKVQPNGVLKLWIDKKDGENNLWISYKFQF